ncbi:MAG TPA: Hsp20/alpha crystallin family protein [Abditibacteriaceae bacterium]|nr:Hsp20/alpha crystallin family protein [Abditibacteriaceae bacterium]
MAKFTPHTIHLLHTLLGPDFDHGEFGMASHPPRWQPRVDMYETPGGIVIQVEAAGLDERQLRLHYEAGQLIVEGQRDRPALPCPARCLQVETDYGPFRRVLPLPADADGNAIEAHYRAGLLVITIARKQPAEPVNVRVSVA